MSVSIERAIAILDPTREGKWAPSEWLTAHRMACQALALLRWISVEESLPKRGDDCVLSVATAKLGEGAYLDEAIVIAEYDEQADQWILENWPEAEDLTVSHWMRLPLPPEEVEA